MKVWDEKGRLFGKINLFDLLVILAVLLVVAGLLYRSVSNQRLSQAASDTTEWIATVKFAAVEPGIADAMRMDDRIFFDADGYVNAKVGEVWEKPAQITVQTSDDQLALVADPYLMDVFADVVIQDINGDGTLKVGRYAVATGGRFALKTFHVYSEGIVIAIRKP